MISGRLSGVYLLVGILAFLLYANTFTHQYAWDDKIVITENPYVKKGIKGIPDLFVKHFSDFKYDKYGYRPVTLSTFAIEQSLAPGKPFLGHFINAVLYGLTCILLFKCLLLLWKQYHWIFAFLVTCIFLSHPLHTEVVANIKSRDEILALLFSLLAWIGFIRYIQGGKWYLIPLSAFYLGLAILSKESAVLGVFVLPMMAWLQKIKFSKKVWGMGAVMATSLGIGWWVYNITVPDSTTVSATAGMGVFEEEAVLGNSFFYANGFLQKTANVFHLLILYLKNFLVAYPLKYFYGYEVIPMNIWYSPITIISFVLQCGMLGIGVWRFKKRPEILWGYLFFLITIFIYLHFLRPLSDTMADRFMFTPSVGLAIWLSGMLGLVFRTRWTAESPPVMKLSLLWPGIKNAGLAAYLILIFTGVNTVLTFSRNKVWKNDKTLVTHDLLYLDNCSRAHYYYAGLLKLDIIDNPNRAGKLEPEMVKHYKRSFEISDKAYNSYLELATYYCHFNRFSEGIPLLEQMVKQFPIADDPKFYLGQSYFHTQRYSEAVPMLEGSLRSSFNQSMNYFFLAMSYSKTGQVQKAISTAQDGLTKFPAEAAMFYDAFGFIYYDQKNLDMSVQYTLMMLEAGAPPKDVYGKVIARCYEMGQKERGDAYLKEAQSKGIQF